MSRFIEQTFESGEFLTASRLNQAYTNIDLVRRRHAGPQAPYGAGRGVWWLDTSQTPWLLKVHDGTTWVAILQINASNNQAQIAGGALPAGTVASGTVLGNYFSSGAITDLIMQDSIITQSDKIANGALVDDKTLPLGISSTMVDSGTALAANIKAATITEDQCGHEYASISGTSASVSISLNEYAFFPCVEGDTFELRCKTGTSSPTTPGFTLVRPAGSAAYEVLYRYLKT